MDVVTAFLNLYLAEEVYMTALDGLEWLGISVGIIFRLRKALYGLKQLSREWYSDIDKSLTEILGFRRLEYDYALYIK